MKKFSTALFILFYLTFLLPFNARLSAASEGEALARAWETYNRKDLDQAEKQFTKLKTSRKPEIALEASMGLGYTLLQQGNFPSARPVFSRLVEQRYKLDKTLPALLDIFVALEDFEAIEPFLPGLDKDHQDRLKKKQLHHQLATLPEGSEKRYQTADELLAMAPGDPFALNVAAWHLYHSKEYRKAQKNFKELLSQNPGDMGSVVGLGYCLLYMKKYDAAEELLEKPSLENTPEIIQLKQNLYRKLVDRAIAQKKRAAAETLLSKLLALDSGNEKDIHRLVRLYRLNENDDMAVKLLKQEFDRTASPSIARALLTVYGEAGLHKEAWDMAGVLADSQDDELKNAAAWYYAANRYPVTASQVMNLPDKFYTNASAPRLEGFAFHRHRSGDPGTSQLDETAIPVSMILSAGHGQQWSLSWASKQLHSGSPEESRAGSYYRHVNGDQELSTLENTAHVQHVFVGLEKEGTFHFSALLGTSPIGGDVSVTPVFSLKGKIAGWGLALHRASVEESILSYAGRKDPYEREAWGRVVKNGISIEKSFLLNRNWWGSAAAGIDRYQGENVLDNTGWQLDFAVGRTLPWRNNWEITWGGYAAFMQYEHNTNFFTYGHGGYYSPEYMVVAGPLFRAKTRPYQRFWIDLQASLGWMMEETADSPFYPLQDTPETNLSAAAANEYRNVYKGEENSGLAFTIKLEGWKMLTKALAGGAFFSMNQTTEYQEWQAGIGLEYTLSPLNGFWKQDMIDKRFGIRHNY